MRAIAYLDGGSFTGRPGKSHDRGAPGERDVAAEANIANAGWPQREEDLRAQNLEIARRHGSGDDGSPSSPELISAAAHELADPITSIKVCLELLLEGAAGDLLAEQERLLLVAQRNSLRALKLIGGMLELVRREPGSIIELSIGPLDLFPIVAEVVESMRPQLEDHDQSLTVHIARRLPKVNADGGRVSQILLNLLANAHESTPIGGSIAVIVRSLEGCVEVSVRDSGAGLSYEQKSQLFRWPVGAPGEAAHQAPGAVLALAATKGIVELHGGEIAVDSARGRGTTFRFTLPRAPKSSGLRKRG